MRPSTRSMLAAIRQADMRANPRTHAEDIVQGEIPGAVWPEEEALQGGSYPPHPAPQECPNCRAYATPALGLCPHCTSPMDPLTTG